MASPKFGKAIPLAHARGSPFVRSVQMGLEEKDAAYQVHAISVQELNGEAHLKRHPFGLGSGLRARPLSPVRDAGDPALSRRQLSRACVRACRSARRRADEPNHRRDWYFFPKVAAEIVGQRIVGSTVLRMKEDEAAVAAAVPLGRVCIAKFDRLLGHSRSWPGINCRSRTSCWRRRSTSSRRHRRERPCLRARGLRLGFGA
jgi:hypothetical protein